MHSSQQIPTRVVNFVPFRMQIRAALDLNSMHSSLMIKQAQYPDIILMIEDYLLRHHDQLELHGYPPGNLDFWFDKQTMIEEFDELILAFRDYVRSVLGLEQGLVYTLMRYRDINSYIFIEGVIDDSHLLYTSLFTHQSAEPVFDEHDPFLPVRNRVPEC